MKKMVYSGKLKREILHSENYKGYNLYIINLGNHPTAYIEIPKGDKYYYVSYDDIDNIHCHGGLTYSDSHLYGVTDGGSWFIGWDYAHAGDYCAYMEKFGLRTNDEKKWTTEEIYNDCIDVINQIVSNNKEEKLKKLQKKIGTYHFKIGTVDGIELDLVEKKNYDELQKKIDRAIEKIYCWGETLNPDFQKEILDILKGDKNE